MTQIIKLSLTNCSITPPKKKKEIHTVESLKRLNSNSLTKEGKKEKIIK